MRHPAANNPSSAISTDGDLRSPSVMLNRSGGTYRAPGTGARQHDRRLCATSRAQRGSLHRNGDHGTGRSANPSITPFTVTRSRKRSQIVNLTWPWFETGLGWFGRPALKVAAVRGGGVGVDRIALPS